MLHGVVAMLLVTSSYAHIRGQGGDQQHLVKHAGCYADSDCGNNQVCNSDGECENEDTICYGDDECRGRQVCDMGRYICVDPTPSPVTTPAPGCCRGSSYKAQAKCQGLLDQVGCERKDCEWLETDDSKDCILTTTSTSTTTVAPGCCYGDSYKANGKCMVASDQRQCESRGCHWLVTDEPNDCVMTTTTTTTTTEEPGCCMGDSSKTNAMCNAREGRERCEKSSSCHFVSGGDVHTDCIIEETTVKPGCCYIHPEQAYSRKYQETCTSFYTERDCVKLTDSNGLARCQFEELIEGYDCSLLWPTTTTTTVAPGCCRGSSYKAQAKCFGLEDQVGCERKDCEWVATTDPTECVLTTTTTTTTTEEPGCCKGDSAKSNPMCNAREGRERCEKSSSCHFVSGGDVEEDCAIVETTVDPGCCYGNPDAAYSKRWMESCTAFYTERECLQLTDGEGVARCAWEPLGEYMDCEMLWPTTTTTTEEPGCCKGSSYKGQAKCLGLTDQDMCARKGCEWVLTDNVDDCILTTTTTTTTTTTAEPGCCMGDSVKTNERCNKMDGRDKCERSSSCHFVSGGVVDVDCQVHETTTEPGCCYGNPDAAYSKKWMESCVAFYTERDCLLLTNGDGDYRCAWESLGEGYDCAQLWPTTTTTSEAPGCCRGSSYKAQSKCLGLTDQVGCERKECEWVETDDATDCVLTTETPTTSTTTTEAPGCCKADSAKRQDMCDLKETSSKCERSSSCHWMQGDDPALCEHPQTEAPEEPGCCYGNPDAAYSKRWMESCTAFYTERDCLLLSNGDGEARCAWESLGEGYDCSQLWPTTTTTTQEPGCCYGDSSASNEMCAVFDDDADKCDGRSQCVFRSGKDADCTFVATEEAGCCKGSTRKNAEMCAEKEGREMCERSGKCEFIATHDDSDCELDTTTSEPWLGAKSESMTHRKRAKGANAQHQQQQAMLFGGAGADSNSVVTQAMQTQVSLSSVLLFVLAAFALQQTYKCFASHNAHHKQVTSLDASAGYQNL